MIRYFISDLHLSDKRLDLIQAFVYMTDQLCQNKVDCELYILGDFFEAYIGDDYQPSWIKQLDAQFLKLSAAGVTTFFIAGNRDFLVGKDWLTRNEVTELTDQSIVQQGNESIMLTHGDEFCVDDHAYQEFRAMVRQPAWQQQVLSMPLEQRMALAQKLRDDSKSLSADKKDTIMDVNTAAIEQTLADNTSVLIHGHTHRPALHQTHHYQRLVLGDWDQNVWLTTMDDQGITQYSLAVSDYLANKQNLSSWQKRHALEWSLRP